MPPIISAEATVLESACPHRKTEIRIDQNRVETSRFEKDAAMFISVRPQQPESPAPPMGYRVASVGQRVYRDRLAFRTILKARARKCPDAKPSGWRHAPCKRVIASLLLHAAVKNSALRHPCMCRPSGRSQSSDDQPGRFCVGPRLLPAAPPRNGPSHNRP